MSSPMPKSRCRCISSSAKPQIGIMGHVFSESRMHNQYVFLKSGMDVICHGPGTFG